MTLEYNTMDRCRVPGNIGEDKFNPNYELYGIEIYTVKNEPEGKTPPPAKDNPFAFFIQVYIVIFVDLALRLAPNPFQLRPNVKKAMKIYSLMFPLSHLAPGRRTAPLQKHAVRR